MLSFKTDIDHKEFYKYNVYIYFEPAILTARYINMFVSVFIAILHFNVNIMVHTKRKEMSENIIYVSAVQAMQIG